MNKKDKIKLEQSFREALIILKRKISDKAPPLTSFHTDPRLRRQDTMNQILERCMDEIKGKANNKDAQENDQPSVPS